MEEIILKRTSFNITTYCNLKCKHCIAFIPYYKEKKMMSYDEASLLLKKYFQIVDRVGHFNVTGGEPLLNKDVCKIMEEVFLYEKQIDESIDFVTNGTLEIPEKLLDLFAERQGRSKIIMSDYGEHLSTKIKQNEELLIKKKIDYRISKFYGDGLYYDGWIDFTDHSLKWPDKEARDNNSRKCVHSAGKYYVINDGEIHRCSRSFYRMKMGIIPKSGGEYVSLTDDLPIEEKKRQMLNMQKSVSGTSCAYCVGLRNDIPRVAPAQQLD